MLWAPTSGSKTLLPATPDHQFEAGSLGSPRPNIFRADVGGGLSSVEHYFAFEVAPELGNVFVVGIEHSRTAGWAATQPVRIWPAQCPQST